MQNSSLPTNWINQYKIPFLLVCFYWIVASASYAGFAAKWGMREDCYRFTLDRVLDGSAHRPYVYRQLVPTLANLITLKTPPELVTKITEAYYFGPFRYYSNADSRLAKFSADYKFKWIIVYWIGFFFLLASLFLLRKILSLSGLPDFAATFAPSIFVLCFPVIQSNGGFYYDFGELFFMLLLVYLVISKKYLGCLIAVLLGTLNKETFLFFIPLIFPFWSSAYAQIEKYLLTLGLFVVSGLVHFIIKFWYSLNPGDQTEWHFFSNIKQYINPFAYLQIDDSYGMITPRGFNLIILLLIFILVKIAWRRFCAKTKNFTYLALAINYPLFLLFGIHVEIRGLSFLYLPCVYLIAHALVAYQEKSYSKIKLNLDS